MEIYKKVEKYNEPIWIIEILLTLFVGVSWIIGCVSEISWVSFIFFSIAQILIGWVSHSAVHNRNLKLCLLGRYEAALLGGLST
jgi:hypothetical protein